MSQDKVGDEIRSIRLVVLLTPSESVALEHLAERLGLTMSSAARMWIREAIERHVARTIEDREAHG